MPCGKNHGSAELQFTTVAQVNGLHTLHTVATQQQPRHLGLEMHLASAVQDGVAHVLDHARQFVGTDVRMGIGQYVRRGSMLAEHVQDFGYAAPFLAAGI